MQHERLVREHMIAEQNQAYEESLQADREKVILLLLCIFEYNGEMWLQERKKKEQEEEEEKERLSKEVSE